MNDESPQGPNSVRSDRVRALRRLSQRSFRQKVQRFLAEGPQVVREAVTHRPDVVREVYLADTATDVAVAVAHDAQDRGLKVITVPEDVLLAFTETVQPQGIAAVCAFIEPPADSLGSDSRLVVLLDQARDPGNAGTVLRAADAAGADAVVFSEGSVDPYNGKCVRSSVGSLFHLPVVTGVDTSDFIEQAKASGVLTLAAAGDADTQLPDLGDALSGPTLWVFGNEAAGLDPAVAERADRSVAVPIYGRAESLNLAAAASVCLYASAFAHARN